MKNRKFAVAATFTFMAACGGDARDEAPRLDTSDVQGEVSPDASTADSTAPDGTSNADTAPLESPRAKIYAVDPLEGGGLTEVTLRHLDTPADTLRGAYAKVRSCTQDLDRGKRTTLQSHGGTVEVVSCVPEANAHADANGDFLHIAPPASPAEDDGRFAEIMMYHHIQVIHDFFKDTYSFSDRDYPFDALTNIATWLSACNAWTYAENAAYVPRGGVPYFAYGLDDTGITGDAIVFSGTATKNFSHDASVIYHEYTHAMIGATRLSGVFLDDEGLNNLPGALNEGYADYIAASLTEVPELGRFALNDVVASDLCGTLDEQDVAQNFARDLKATRRCPDDLVGEVHADSEIFSTALWAIREKYGKLKADTIALYAVMQLTDRSDFKIATAATISGAGELYGPEIEAEVRAIFEARNLVDCSRVVPIERVGTRGIDIQLDSPRWYDPNPFGAFIPGYVQFGFTVPANTKRIILTFDAVAGYGGGGNLGLEAAIKLGGSPVHYNYGGNGTTTDADLTLPVDSGKRITIENPNNITLREGPWAFALHNTGTRGVRVRGIRATFE